MKATTDKVEKVVIVGSGPAGHTAAIYASRARLEPLVYEGFMAGGVAAGGQLTTTTDVENYPGFPTGISGPKLMDLMREQSLQYGARIETKTVGKVDLSQRPFVIYAGQDRVACHSLIIATGAIARRLHLPSEEDFWQKGISACAVCDGALPIFRDQVLVVIGGGDSACEETIYLTKYAKKVYMLHRRDTLRASRVMQDRVLNNSKIEVLWNAIAKDVAGDDKLQSLTFEKVTDNTIATLEIGGLFYAIGHTPNTGFFRRTAEIR